MGGTKRLLERPERAQEPCGKHVYASEEAARQALRFLQRRQKTARLHRYFCRPCRGYHIGHSH